MRCDCTGGGNRSQCVSHLSSQLLFPCSPATNCCSFMLHGAKVPSICILPLGWRLPQPSWWARSTSEVDHKGLLRGRHATHGSNTHSSKDTYNYFLLVQLTLSTFPCPLFHLPCPSPQPTAEKVFLMHSITFSQLIAMFFGQKLVYLPTPSSCQSSMGPFGPGNIQPQIPPAIFCIPSDDPSCLPFDFPSRFPRQGLGSG